MSIQRRISKCLTGIIDRFYLYHPGYKTELAFWKSAAEARLTRALICEAEALKAIRELHAAHKGIRRLVERVKVLKRELAQRESNG
jgi:hypothetical protein